MGCFCPVMGRLPIMGIFVPKWAIEILYVKKLIIYLNMKLQDRPKCGCGNTSNPDGYCDGSHNKI
jgi:hypothetical protein